MKLIIMVLPFIISGCIEHHHGSLKDKLQKLDENKVEVKSDQISKTRLDGFTYQKSEWKKKESFHVLERYNNFELQKCKDCHDSKKAIPRGATNHKDLKLRHANKDIMSCKTCHNKKDTWNLHMFEGEKVSINHPYKLCSQCHFQQVDDWSNGAHGKRVGGWYGKRVIKNCTDCHDPHKPQFHKQMPKVTPQFLRFKKE
jgi:hypothetical protein